MLLPTGPISAAPGALGALLTRRSIASMSVGGSGIHITLAPDSNWRALGPEVRTALEAALEQPPAWRPAGASDGEIGEQVVSVLAGPAGALIAQHGGSVRVRSVREGILDLEVGGACAGCPAAGLTFQTTLDAVLRREVPGLREIHYTEGERPRFVRLGRMIGQRP